ncbi:MAG: ABC transporter substrate-binding protein [Gammaproteobacteria bacterium]|nr:ABC transporter substrate-binding protein [Gammaproteobacteria bacterium]
MFHKVAILLSLVLLPATATALDQRDVNVFIATWRGCEEACQGFKDYLSALGRGISFQERDAGQDKNRLPQMLAQARAANADLILSWGTSVTKAIAGDLGQRKDPSYNHEIPQVFMIVADPVGSGIVESLDKTGRPNLTGTYNRMPETVTIRTIRSYLPAFDTLGLLYNGNEPNSVQKYRELDALSKIEGFTLIAIPLTLTGGGMPDAAEIAPKVHELASAGADFIYVGSSSFLQANSALLGAAVRDAKLPLLSPYEEAVREGNALMSVAASYYEVGRLAGRQAEAIIIGGREPGELPVARMTQFAVTINLSMAKQIGLFPPVGLLQVAEIVE